MIDFEIARERHQAGDLQEADRLYQQVLAANPSHTDALHMRGIICMQRGDVASATKFIEQAVNIEPHNIHYQNNLGEAYRLSGKFMQAENCFRKAITLDCRQAEAHSNLGLILRERGDTYAAVDCFRKALSVNERFVEAAINLGASLNELGELDQAIAVFREAVRISPNLFVVRVHFGACLLDAGQISGAVSVLEEARKCFPRSAQVLLALGEAYVASGELGRAGDSVEETLAIDSRNARAHYVLADIRLMQERLDLAENAILVSLSLEPENATYLSLKGWILRAQGRLDESLSVLGSALSLAPGDISLVNNRAETLLALGDEGEALRELYKSLQADPLRSDTHNAIGNCLLARGDSEQAVDHFRRALAANPQLVVAWESLARARKFSNEDREEIARLETLARSKNLTDSMKSALHYALGKLEDDCGEYDRAFAHYRQANEIRSRSLTFDSKANARAIDRRISVFDHALFEEKKCLGSASHMPIFIVGMLRSGTTLVEQILSSHSKIHAAGELSLFTNIKVSEQAMSYPEQDYLDGIHALTQANASQLSREYLSYLTRAGKGCLRATDKMPNNFLHLGLIALLFPNAKVVHCRRNPLDNGLSIFFQHLGSLNPYACDLNAIGRYYREYLRLMEHWTAVLPIRIHEVTYEQLVSTQEETTRHLIAYCGLDWEDACLNYDRNRRAVLTPSDWQVHQPIYSGSVNRWKRYQTHIGPLQKGLAGLSG